MTEACECIRPHSEIWADHPRRFVVEATPDFLAKAKSVIDIICDELPECCGQHSVPEVDAIGASVSGARQ